MNVVLLSGGSGKRLWPLSNDTLSKQFLKLLKNDRDEYESMVQRVMRQLRLAHPDVNVYVSSNIAQADTLHRQLGVVDMVLEPSRRNTFPAIVLAAAYLYYHKQLDENDVFVACPIDVFAESRYFELFGDMSKMIRSNQYEIGLMGVSPTYPSEKYGYILQESGEVTGFREKPSEKQAESLISGGALWNCGVFALKIGYVLKRARNYIDFDSFSSLYEQYSKLPSISFDYEVVEKEKSIGVVEYCGEWKDLGTWNTLTEEIKDVSIGDNILVAESCKNTHVLNMLSVPIIVQDISDAIVVASHDGIMVSSKHGSSFLKPLADRVNMQPMYGQRLWGNYRVLEYKQTDEFSSMVKRVHIDAGQSFEYQGLSEPTKVWVIINGKGILTVDGVDSVVSSGSVITMKHGATHSLLAATELELVEVQFGVGEISEEALANIVK